MARQHTTPLLLDAQGGGAVALIPLALPAVRTGSARELFRRSSILTRPACRSPKLTRCSADPFPSAWNSNTPAGSSDNFMVTPSGLPVLVECKLWRNPEGRREVTADTCPLADFSSLKARAEAFERLRQRTNDFVNSLRPRIRAALSDLGF